MQKNKTLIITDLDGTLLNSKKEISLKTVKTINNLIEHNALFTVATSRYYKTLNPYIRCLNITAPIITSNGSLIYDRASKEILLINSIDNQAVIDFVDFSKNNNLEYILHTKDKLYISSKHPRIERFRKINQNADEIDQFFPTIIDDTFNTNFQEVFQMSIYTSNYKNISSKLRNILKRYSLNIHYSGDNILTVVSSLSSKGNGIRFLCNYLSINIKDTICFGDNENDCSMFKLAGHPVAMDNANKKIKSYAEYITQSNNNDGVANAIIDYFKLST